MEKPVEIPQTEKKKWITPDIELISGDDIRGKNYTTFPEDYVVFPGITGLGS
ncbi:MAG: hypothetical protein ACXVJD_04700 [Mucilaginibacter sp.]